MIYLYGAIDRNNFGDLLLPIVIKAYLSQKLGIPDEKFQGVGMRTYDGVVVGGIQVKSLKWLTDKRDEAGKDCIIVVGGEIFGATWISALKYLASPTTAKLFYRIAKLIPQGLMSRIIQICFGVKNISTPFILTKDYFQFKPRVVYAPCGGSALPFLPSNTAEKIMNNLTRVDLLAARDAFTHNYFNARNVSSQLVPDIVTIASDLFPACYVKERASPAAINFVDTYKENFMCFQIRKSLVRGRIQKLAHMLNRITTKKNLKCILLPLAEIEGHCDRDALRDISGRCAQLEIFESKNIWDKLYLIINARLFVGSSLHGAIAAMSYGVPWVSIKGMKKVKVYIETWYPDAEKVLTDVAGLETKIHNALSDSNQLNNFTNLSKLKNAVYDYFSRMEGTILL